MAVADNLLIRWMIKDDVGACIDIDALSFDDFWGEPEFLAHSRRKDGISAVAESDGEIWGYICYEFDADHFRIVRLAVHPDDRRKGYGRALIGRVVSKLSKRRPTLLACVDERNAGGIAFLSACGLLATGVVKRQFGDSDGYLFQKVAG